MLLTSPRLAWPLLLPFLLGSAGFAQISAGGLGTRVNGSQFGSCRVGNCAVHGGSRAGDNLFHRFSQFDTRSGIEELRIDAAGRRNVILSVTNPAGTFLNVPLKLTEAANLFLLSPGGLWLGQGGQFHRVSNLLLSTGVALDLPGGRFDAIHSGRSDLADLGAGPELRFDSVATSAGQGLVIGAPRGGSLVIDRTLLSLEGGLIVDAATGPLTLREAHLHAGQSLRLSGQGFALRDSSLSVGEPGRRGPIELRTNQDPVSGNFASGVLERVQLSGNQVNITAGSLRLVDSQIAAPKGWVELQTTNPPGQAADLTLIGSRIDLNPRDSADLWSPQILRRQQSDGSVQEIRNPAPHIGLFSRGNLQFAGSFLDASLLVPSGAKPAPDTILASLPQRAGVIFAEAAGSIWLDKSNLRADASHTLAGYVLMEAGRDLPGALSSGELALRDSKLSTSFGAGGGAIVLQADRGLSVVNSNLEAMNNRQPQVAGFTPPPGLQPAFVGGQITLYNSSDQRPLLISSSTISANHYTSAGPLASPFFKAKPDENGFGAFGSSPDAWTVDLAYSYSGGFLQIYSEAGIRVEKGTLLDVSSRDPDGGKLENIAGSIVLLNTGPAPIEIVESRLDGRNGPARDPVDVNAKAGSVYILGDGSIHLQQAEVDLTAASLVVPQNPLFEPYLSIGAGERLTVSGASVLLAQPVQPRAGEPAPPEEPNYGINLFDSFVQPGQSGAEVFSRMNLDDSRATEPVFSFPEFYTLPEIFKNFSAVLEKNSVVFERAYTASATAVPAWPLPLASLAPNALSPQPLLLQPLARMDTAPMAVESSADAGQKLLEGQQLALADTIESLGLPPASGRVRSMAELQQRLRRVEQRIPGTSLAAMPDQSAALPTAAYRPAIVQLGVAELPGDQVQLNAILLTANGEPLSFSQLLPAAQLKSTVRAFQRQVSRQEWRDPTAAAGPAARLASWLLQPLAAALRASDANALLLAVDRGLQAIPFGALPFGDQPLAERYALSVTPSLGLLDLDAERRVEGGLLLAAGASTFLQSLAPLPMVPRELAALAGEQSAAVLLDEAFTVDALRRQAVQERFRQLHIATHAEFHPGQDEAAVLFTPRENMSLKALRESLRVRSPQRPLDLITLSACHTALGDERSELGFVGMALQAGARSAIGTLWEVEDAASAAFFIQYYRYLRSGLGKDQALQATARAFRNGSVRLVGDALVGPRVREVGDSKLIAIDSLEERRRLAEGLQHPHFWAGMVLTGSPW
jgi:CHAT domain-containing protein